MDLSVCLCDVAQGYPDSNRWASLDTGFERPMGALFALLVHRLYVVCVCVLMHVLWGCFSEWLVH